jgi:hypothetical protein
MSTKAGWKAAMDNLARLRQALTRVAKVQRRIWLVQATFWPVVALGCFAAASAVARLVWNRRNTAAKANDVTDPPNWITDAQATDSAGGVIISDGHNSTSGSQVTNQ